MQYRRTKYATLLLLLGSQFGTKTMFGRQNEVDPFSFLLGSTVGWSSNPPGAAIYLPAFPTENDDGSITSQFGGDPKDAPNFLSVSPGWNYTVRLHRPRQPILEGARKFPEARPFWFGRDIQ